MKELQKKAKLAQLQQHEREWIQARYNAQVNHDVAVAIGEADMMSAAKKAMVRAEKALGVIREKIEELE